MSTLKDFGVNILLERIFIMVAIVAVANGVISQNDDGFTWYVFFCYFIGSMCISAWEGLRGRHNSNS